MFDISFKNQTSKPSYVARQLHYDLLEHRVLVLVLAIRAGHTFVVLAHALNSLASLVTVVRDSKNILTTRDCHEPLRVIIRMNLPANVVTKTHDKPGAMTSNHIRTS